MRRICKGMLIVFLVLLALLGLLCAGKFVFDANYAVIDGETHSFREKSLDLSGKPVENLDLLAKFTQLEHLDLRGTGITLGQQQWLQKQLPDCEIEWEIQFQDAWYPPDAHELTISTLNTGEVVVLDFLPELTRVDASQCRDYEALRMLEERHPGCEVDYCVELGGSAWERDVTELELENVTPALLEERLPSLPLVETVTLRGILPTMQEIRGLEKTYPDIDFRWQVELGGLQLDAQAETMDLSGSKITDTEEFVENLPYFPNLKSVDLRGTLLDNAQKASLAEVYPDLEFQWEVAIGTALVPADAEEADISGQTFESSDVIREALPCFEHLKKLIVCDSGLSHEELDRLNRDFPDTRVVWNIDIDGYNLRTDDLYFAPNKYGNNVNDERLEPLRYCTDLQCVDVGHGSITHCEWAASMPNLRYLIIADTGVRDITPLAGLENLVFLEMFQTKVQDYSPLLDCPALEDLNLCYTYGDPEPIMKMTWLKRLWWSGSRASAATLSEHLPDTEVNCKSLSSTGDSWRLGQNYYDMRDLIGMFYMTG